MNKKVWRGVYLAVLFVVALALVQWGRSGGKEENTPVDTNKPASVKMATVENGSMKASLVITGSVSGKREVVITAKTQGTINRLAVKTGDRVGAGTVLASIDPVNQQLGLDKTRDQVAAAGLILDKAKKDFDRVNELYRQGAVSKSEFEGAEYSYNNARVFYNLAVSDSRLADEALKNTSVTAPFSGSVTEKFTEEGEVASPGSRIVTLVDDSSLIIKANVSADQIHVVSKGQKGIFTSTLYPGKEYGCVVTAINARAEQSSRTYAVELELTSEAGQILKPGMFGEISLSTGEVKRTLMPRDAVVAIDEAGKADVYVIRGGKAYRKKVVTGDSDDRYLAVISGIDAGDKVVVFGQSLLKEGTSVVEGE